MYELKWEKGETIRISEFDVPLPDMPKFEDMLNYELPTNKQKFNHLEIPKNLKFKSQTEQDTFVYNEYWKRWNGEWLLINGKPVYLTGIHYWYLNNWRFPDGKRPDFRWHDCLFFYFWDMCVRDERCLGMLDLKPRRVGDTDKRLAIAYEYATRVRGAICGMQNLDNDRAFKDYNRIVIAHNQIHWTMKPMTQGSDNPRQGLIFRKPSRKVTENSLIQSHGLFDAESENIEALNSEIDYEATMLGKYDGQKLHRYGMGEFGKWIKVSAAGQWEIIKPCLMDNTFKIIGKGILESTVEDFENEKGSEGNINSMITSKELWEDSSPEERDAMGRTRTGLYRIFRDAATCGDVDEFGFPLPNNKETILSIIHAQKDPRKKISLRRKYPLELNDCFLTSENNALFDQNRVQERIFQINNHLDIHGRSKGQDNFFEYPEQVTGDLVWMDGRRFGNVMFIPNNAESAKVIITRHPREHERNIYNIYSGQKTPVNGVKYAIGIDPIEHKLDDGRYSLGSAAVFYKWDASEDGIYEDDLTENAAYLKSDQWVCTYLGRPENPEDFYDDMAKIAIYYSAPVFPETQKSSGLDSYFMRNGLINYLQRPPKMVATKKKKGFGAPSNEFTINQYVDLMLAYFNEPRNGWMRIHNLKILEQFATFVNTSKGRGSHDLVVACGFSLLASLKNYKAQQDKAENEQLFRAYKLRR